MVDSEKSKKFGASSTAEEVTAGVDLSGKNWLVTGCRSGLGRETLRVLSLRGAHVFAATRRQAQAEQCIDALGVQATALGCDLSDLSAVQALTRSLKEKGTVLDGIITNAGVMAIPTLEQKNGIEMQLYTNHIGHFLLVTELLECLSAKARVVVLSSGAYRMAGDKGLDLQNLSGEQDYDPWRMYGRSKLANLIFAKSLARRFSASGSQQLANAVHPGVIETELARHVPQKEAMFEKMRAQVKTVAQGAATQCYVATRPELAKVSGRYFSDCQAQTTTAITEEEPLAEELWARSEEIVARYRS